MKTVKVGAIKYKSQKAAISAMLKQKVELKKVIDKVGCSPAQAYIVRDELAKVGKVKKVKLKIDGKEYRNNSEAIVDLLKNSNLSQHDIAKKIGCTDALVSIVKKKTVGTKSAKKEHSTEKKTSKKKGEGVAVAA